MSFGSSGDGARKYEQCNELVENEGGRNTDVSVVLDWTTIQHNIVGGGQDFVNETHN